MSDLEISCVIEDWEPIEDRRLCDPEPIIYWPAAYGLAEAGRALAAAFNRIVDSARDAARGFVDLPERDPIEWIRDQAMTEHQAVHEHLERLLDNTYADLGLPRPQHLIRGDN